jgi:hypothetical protein
VFDHAGLQLYARCTNTTGGQLLLRAFNAGTHNAVIKTSYLLGSAALTTTDSTAPTGNPSTTAYSATPAGTSTGAFPVYSEDDQFNPGENWDYDPATSGMTDSVGKLVFTDDVGNVVAVEYLAHQKSGDEDPFIGASGVGCVFAGQALYNPGT